MSMWQKEVRVGKHLFVATIDTERGSIELQTTGVVGSYDVGCKHLSEVAETVQSLHTVEEKLYMLGYDRVDQAERPDV